MNRKLVSGVLIAMISIIAVIFIIKGELYLSVLFMTLLFASTNGIRAVNLKEKGFEREAKWMRAVSIFFVASFVGVLLIILM